MPEPLTRAWLVAPHRSERHCGYIYARKRRRARRLALATDPYRGPAWYLHLVRRAPGLDGLCPYGTTIWEPAEIPCGVPLERFRFSVRQPSPPCRSRPPAHNTGQPLHRPMPLPSTIFPLHGALRFPHSGGGSEADLDIHGDAAGTAEPPAAGRTCRSEPPGSSALNS